MTTGIRLVPMLALAVVAGCRAGSAPAPAAPRTSAYVVMLGRDTIAVDQYTRVGDWIDGTLVLRTPRTTMTRYLVTLNSDGSPATAESSVRLPDGTTVPGAARGVVVSYGRDTAVTRVQRDSTLVVRTATRGAWPYLNFGTAFFQLPIDALRSVGDDSLATAILPIGGRATTPLTIRRAGPNRFVADLFGFRYEVRTDDRGTVQAVDGTGTTQQVLVTRRNAIDVAAIANAWAERERQTRAMGQLSPRDTAVGILRGDTIRVDYGRPFTRGRQVFAANGILNDTLWRTGANAATQLWTNKPLRIGGQLVPAGKYTLWTAVAPGGGRYQLVVNKQTGQWGTVYDRAQDLVRVPLTVATMPEHVEQFTIVVDAAGDGALRLRWATTELSVPISAPE